MEINCLICGKKFEDNSKFVNENNHRILCNDCVDTEYLKLKLSAYIEIKKLNKIEKILNIIKRRSSKK